MKVYLVPALVIVGRSVASPGIKRVPVTPGEWLKVSSGVYTSQSASRACVESPTLGSSESGALPIKTVTAAAGCERRRCELPPQAVTPASAAIRRASVEARKLSATLSCDAARPAKRTATVGTAEDDPLEHRSPGRSSAARTCSRTSRVLNLAKQGKASATQAVRLLPRVRSTNKLITHHFKLHPRLDR